MDNIDLARRKHNSASMGAGVLAICTRDFEKYSASSNFAEVISQLGEFRFSFRTPIRLLVVDNSGRSECSPSFDLPEQLSLIWEARRGIPFARNAALVWALSSSSNWMVFLDDDVVPNPGWLRCLFEDFFEQGAEVVQGKIDYVYPKEYPEHYPRLRLPEPTNDSRLAFASTANVIFALDPVRKAGLKFREDLSEVGGSDTAFFMQLSELGCSIGYSQRAGVVESLEGVRTKLSWQFKRRLRTSQDSFQLLGYFVHRGETLTYGNSLGRLFRGLRVTLRFIVSTGILILRPMAGRKAFLDSLMEMAPLIALLLLNLGFRIREYKSKK